MGVEAVTASDLNHPLMADEFLKEEPLNGTDSRRRLEDKIEELRLKRELQEYDFDF